MKNILSDKNLTILFISTFLFFTNEALFLPALPLHLAAAGYTNLRISVVLGAFAFGVLLARPITGYITDRFGRKISLIAVFLISEISTLMVMVVTATLFGVGSAYCSPALSAFVADNSDPGARGTVFSFFSGAFDIGVHAAGVILGVVADIDMDKDDVYDNSFFRVYIHMPLNTLLSFTAVLLPQAKAI